MRHTKRFAINDATTLAQGEAYVVINTDTLDRDGEVVIPRGANWKDYLRDPIVLWQHDHADPIGTTLALTRMDRAISAHMRFAKRPDWYEGAFRPDFIRALVADRVIRAASVSFESTPDGTRTPTKKDREQYGDGVRRVFSHWKLLEWSFVSVGANPDALVVAAEKSGADRATVKAWTGEEVGEIPAVVRKRVRIVVPAMPARSDIAKATRIEIARQRGALRLD